MDIKPILQQLSEANGPSGLEEAVAAQIADLLRPLCDEVSVDDLFNVVGVKRGDGPEPRPKLMLMAHQDEVRLLVTALEGEFLRFHQSKIDPRLLVGQEVTVLGKQPLLGVIGDRPPHLLGPEERKKMPEPQNLVIDLGMDAAAVAENVRIGDVMLVRRPFIELLGERVAGKALDNRLSVTAMLETLAQLQRRHHACDVLAVASVGEEWNTLGAQTATFRLRPDLAVVLDVTFAKQPGTTANASFALGGGPALGIGPNLHPRLNDTLVETAESLELDFPVEPLPAGSGTDAWPVYISAGGVPTALLSIPIRNMHSPVEVADLGDLRRTARWLAAFIPQIDAEFVENLAYRLPDFDEEEAA